MAKKFRARVSADFEITDDGKTVGWIRVKPNGVLWAPKGKHSCHRLTIEDFAKFAKKRGTAVKR